jgi:hypothetical protein
MLREQQREEHGVEALELIATEEKVVLGVRSTQLQEIGGVPLGRQIFQVFTLRHHDGRIVWVDEYRRRGAGGRWSRISGRLAIGAAGAESPRVTPPPHSSLSSVKMMLLFYLRTSRLWAPSPSGTRKRKAGRSDSIRSKGFKEDRSFNLRSLCRSARS